MDIVFTHEGYRRQAPANIGYDVTITANKIKGEYSRIRFGFLSSVFDKIHSRPKFIQVSNARYSGPRIYFKFSDDPEGQTYKMQSQPHKNNMYIAMQPTGEEAEILKLRWVNNAYILNYDATRKLFYIEQHTPDSLEDTEVKEK